MRRRLLALLFGTTAATAALAGAEAWQRAHELGSMQVDFDPPGIKYSMATDDADRGRGWREGREPPARTPGVHRIVCLGDSVTYGVSVGARDTWCEVMRHGVGHAEAFNFGVNGYDAEQVATVLESKVAAWEPDVVVWGTYVNDVFPTYLLYGLESGDPVFVGTDIPPQARLLPEPVALWLVRHSALFRRLQGAAYARSQHEQVGERSAAPDRYSGAVDRVLAWSQQTKIPVVFLAIPPHVMSNMANCPNEFPVPGLCEASLKQYKMITEAIFTRGGTYVDGLAAFQVAFQAGGPSSYHPETHKDPDHPNAAGHRVLGLAVTPAVRAALGIDADEPGDPVVEDATGQPSDHPRGRDGARRPGAGRHARERAAQGAP